MDLAHRCSLIINSEKDENGNTIITNGRNLIQYTHSNGVKYVKWKNDNYGESGPILPQHLNRFIGIGSTVRFPSETWTQLGDKKYRKRDFTVKENSVKFWNNTEVNTNEIVYKLKFYQWVVIGNNSY